MRHHTLTRFDIEGGDGTFGRFERWATMEDDWLGNRPFVSCIPSGEEYLCRRRMYNKGGYEVFEVTGVPGRSLILIGHYANTEEDVQGCIGLGLKLGVLLKTDEDNGERRHKLAVLSTRVASKEFMHFFKGVDEWMLKIVDYDVKGGVNLD